MLIMDYVAGEDKQEEIKKYGMVYGNTVVAIKSLQDFDRVIKFTRKTLEKLSLKYNTQNNEGKSHFVGC